METIQKLATESTSTSKSYRELLREEVAQTLTDPAEIEDELRGLFEALGA